jgi:hypothetical protein
MSVLTLLTGFSSVGLALEFREITWFPLQKVVLGSRRA